MRDGSSHSVGHGAGRALPLYQALLECRHRDGPRLVPGTAASIWHAIDRLRAENGAGDEVSILEEIAVQVHLLRQRLDRLDEDANGDLAPRGRIALLTRQWLEVATLRA